VPFGLKHLNQRSAQSAAGNKEIDWALFSNWSFKKSLTSRHDDVERGHQEQLKPVCIRLKSQSFTNTATLRLATTILLAVVDITADSLCHFKRMPQPWGFVYALLMHLS
jgi:hypothetical protein